MKQDMASASAKQDKNLAILLLLPVCFILEHGKSQKQEEILLSSMLEDGIVTAE